ncbi:glycosyltransferase family 2 protein [Cribrihabitans sp. XS_ASV171]
MTGLVSIILPAHDEAAYIDACLGALLASDPLPAGWVAEVIVVANGCMDDTADRARAHGGSAAARGWSLTVVELAQGGKLGALNTGDGAARGRVRAYLDADVQMEPALLAALVTALDTEAPRYASGCPRVAPAQSDVTRAYARFWQGLPFVTEGVPGFGVFAMTLAGRARWGDWPDIISDDTFARLNFAPEERVRVSAGYSWPMVEGFARLVRVRRRQNAGVAEVAERFPALLRNDDIARPSTGGMVRRLLRDPVGFVTYGAVALAVKSPLYRSGERWARGR